MTTMKRLLWVLLIGTAFGQCQVVKWETQAYSQSAHITRNHIVYTVRIDGKTYQIARRRDKIDLPMGVVDCRVDKDRVVVQNGQKTVKYDIIGLTN